MAQDPIPEMETSSYRPLMTLMSQHSSLLWINFRWPWLKDRFGHPFNIAHLNQVTRGPPVKPNDQRGLLAFADQL